MPFFTSNGANIYLDVSGAGTSVLFVHGLTLDNRQWTPQREVLVERYRILRMDLRGHGRSASAVGGHDERSLAEDVQRALVQSGMQRLQPGFLVGHGYACDAVVRTALAEPRLLKGIALVSPYVSGVPLSDTWTTLLENMRAHARAGRVDAALAAWRDDVIWEGVRKNAELERIMRSMQAGFSGDWLRASAASAKSRSTNPETPTLERLADCRVPILIVRPAGDREDFKEAASRIAAAAPRAHVAEIGSCGHYANLEAPESFSRVLEHFMRELA